MQFRVFFLNLILSFVLVGCSLMPNEMKTAQKVMDSNPDSALHILQRMHPNQSFLDADRALYGILLFQALDKSNKPLQPDSAINFSVNYYQNSNDKHNLAVAYYYKARLYKRSQQLDKATIQYLKLLDMVQKNNNLELMGKIYSDLGDICAMQADFKNSLEKHLISYDYFKKSGNISSANYKLLDVAKSYRLMKDHKSARLNYNKLLLVSKDSFLHGLVYQEIGINFYEVKRYDSAEYFLRKSLNYPFKGVSYSVRNYVLADLYFDMNKFDSATIYASNSLKYPANFVTSRECYRILVNSSYSLRDLVHMAPYITKYQEYSDSVRRIEKQTKTSVLENLHQTNGTVNKSIQSMIILAVVILLITLTSFFIVFILRSRNQTKETELSKAKETISEKQIILRDNLIRKIEETKTEKASLMKGLSIKEKEAILLEIYNRCLQLENWNKFSKLMNQTFNNLIQNIEKGYPEINQKEIVWICLFLLNITLADVALILDCQIGSLYKLKQRLAQKMNLSSTKELELALHNMSTEK